MKIFPSTCSYHARIANSGPHHLLQAIRAAYLSHSLHECRVYQGLYVVMVERAGALAR